MSGSVLVGGSYAKSPAASNRRILKNDVIQACVPVYSGLILVFSYGLCSLHG